jgi:tRNA synthetases class I (M)
LRGYNTLYICGMSEYRTEKIGAISENSTPRSFCDRRRHAIHSEIYEWFNIRFDHFGSTSTPAQTQITQGSSHSLFSLSPLLPSPLLPLPLYFSLLFPLYFPYSLISYSLICPLYFPFISLIFPYLQVIFYFSYISYFSSLLYSSLSSFFPPSVSLSIFFFSFFHFLLLFLPFSSLSSISAKSYYLDIL